MPSKVQASSCCSSLRRSTAAAGGDPCRNRSRTNFPLCALQIRSSFVPSPSSSPSSEMADKPASYQLPTANRGPAMIVLNAPNPSIRNVVMATACFVTLYLFTSLHQLFPESHLIHVPLHAERVLAECASLNTLPGPSPMFWDRSSSERFEPGTKAQYIFNATIWTGLNNGTEGR